MATDTFSIECALAVPVPVIVSYVLNSVGVQRCVGPSNGAPITVYKDSGSSVTVFAPKSAQSGSITNDPPDLKTYRFVSWTKTSGTPVYTQSYTVTPSASDVFTVLYEETTVHTTRNPSRRATKLQAKTDEEVAQLRTTALKPLQVKNQAITAYEQTSLETNLGTYLCGLGIIGNDQHHYRNFAQELYGLRKTFTQATLTAEARLRAIKWLGRGLVWATMQGTAKLQGIDIGTSP